MVLKKRLLRRSDGSLVPYRERQFSNSLLKALAAAGEGDRALADELAGAVSLFLQRFHEDAVPAEADVKDMLVRVLRETGHGEAARFLERAEGERRWVESQLLVKPPGFPGPAADGPGDPDRPQAWDRGRLVRHLTVIRGLPETLAEEVASEVELRLARLRLPVVSRTLIRELVEGELDAQAIEAFARVEELPGFTGREVEEHLLSGEQECSLADRISGRALSAYALHKLHAPVVRDAVSGGAMHLYGVESPFHLEGLTLRCDLLGLPSGCPFRRLASVSRALSVLDDHVRGEVYLPDLLETLAAGRGGWHPSELSEAVVEALDKRNAFAVESGFRIRLAVPLTDPGEAQPLRSLVAAVMEEARRGRAPALRLCYRPGEKPLVDGWSTAKLDDLARVPGTELEIARGKREPLVRPPPRRLEVGLGRVAINLPLALLGADPKAGLQGALECLRPAASAAATALHERYWQQRSGVREGLHGLVVFLGGPGDVDVAVDDQWAEVEVWGLAQALDLLAARGIVSRARRVDGAARILGFIDYIMGEDRSGVRFQIRLGATRDRSVRGAFLQSLEAEGARAGASELKDLLSRAEGESVLPVALPILNPRNRPLLRAPFAERLGRGLALSLSAFESDPVGSVLDSLAAESRLSLFTLVPRRPGEDLFEVQEELFS